MALVSKIIRRERYAESSPFARVPVRYRSTLQYFPRETDRAKIIPAALALYARFMMAEGVGNHPTPDGYEFLAAKILDAIKNPEAHKPSDEVAKAVAELMQVIGDAAWKYAEDKGIVDAVNDLYEVLS